MNQRSPGALAARAAGSPLGPTSRPTPTGDSQPCTWGCPAGAAKAAAKPRSGSARPPDPPGPGRGLEPEPAQEQQAARTACSDAESGLGPLAEGKEQCAQPHGHQETKTDVKTLPCAHRKSLSPCPGKPRGEDRATLAAAWIQPGAITPSAPGAPSGLRDFRWQRLTRFVSVTLCLVQWFSTEAVCPPGKSWEHEETWAVKPWVWGATGMQRAEARRAAGILTHGQCAPRGIWPVPAVPRLEALA